MFEGVLSEWNAYSIAKVPRDTPLWNLVGEVDRRLEQLDIAVAHVNRSIEELDRAEGDELATWDEIIFFAEAFYLFAWRLLVVLRSRKFEFPGMRGVDVRGVTIVRNHLIEHPEANGQDFSQVFELDPAAGPVLKCLGGKDRGLFVNAAELRDALLRRLARASET